MPSTYLAPNVHLVFATADRAPLIADAWLRDFHAYLGGTAKGLGAIPIAVGGVSDHVHLLLGIKATHNVAHLVRDLRKSAGVWARRQGRDLDWQVGYGAFSVGTREVDGIRAYIRNQAEHHKSLSSADEYRSLLDENGIEIDERHFE